MTTQTDRKPLRPRRTLKRRKTGQVRFSVATLKPSPENDRLYRPVDPADPDIIALAESVARHGVLEPLVVTTDRYIISGHRRYVAAKLAGLKTVPCRVEPIRRRDSLDAFVALLREHNRQREKSLDEKLREEVASMNPETAHRALVKYRARRSAAPLGTLDIGEQKRRSTITAAKAPMLNAALAVLEERRDYWPLTVRQIHYALLNWPPLRHAGKPGSRYTNTIASYKDLSDLLTRARLAEFVPMEAIEDETRPVTLWNVWREPAAFVRDELDKFLCGYWRDLMQSQPNHIELVGEKNTIAPILRSVAEQYCIPLTTGRGYCSLPPRHAMAERYRKSGKAKLILLLVSDFDPDGQEIAASFARSMRDDFDIADISASKVALTAEQVKRLELPPVMKAKESSAQHDKFVREHGTDVFEVEALPPADLAAIVTAAIDSVIDRSAFKHELEAEQRDAAFLAGVRNTVRDAMAKMDLTADKK